MKTDCFLGVDTSNYTTSLAAADPEGRVIFNLKAPLPVRAGACGLRQSDAVFAHVKNLPALFRHAGEILGDRFRVTAVGVSTRPRPLADSYMPCFLSGMAAAESFAVGAGVRVLPFSHQEGHIRAAVYSAGGPDLLAPFGAFHVSGGTTDLLLVSPAATGFSLSEEGTSDDLHAGQAVDRIGVMLGLPFPAGPALEKLAAENQKPVPHARVCVREGRCHLSGLQNLAEKLYAQSNDPALVAAFALHFLSDTLFEMATDFRARHGAIPLLFAGGVMSNRLIAAELTARLSPDVFFAAPEFSADNAAGIALLCRDAALAGL